jgi:hypothetical protein
MQKLCAGGDETLLMGHKPQMDMQELESLNWVSVAFAK